MERAARKGHYPYYGATSVMGYVDDYLFDGDYILLGEDGSVQDDQGYPILQRVYEKFWVNNHAHILQGVQPVNNNYLIQVLKNTKVGHIVTGAVQPKISQGNLNSLEIILPEREIIIEFQNRINETFDLLKSNNSEIEVLSKLRDLLLPKLISGEIIPSHLQTIEQAL